MASGDTKTESYLRAAAEGTRADLPSDTCCNTKTQNLILGVAERIMDVEDEVEELKNNPDVVDIVDTYQDLQAYDTSTLTDKDIIRVLEDSTHNNNSTFYRWNASTNQFDYIGEVSGGVNVVQTIGTSTTDVMSQKAVTDTLFHENNATRIQIGSNASSTGGSYYPSVAIGRSARATGGSTVCIGSGTASGYHSLSLGDSTANQQGSIAIGYASEASGAGSIAIGGYSGSGNEAQANGKGSIAIGVGAKTTTAGEVNIGDRNGTHGYNTSNYRLLTGLYDPQNAHDAATKGYVDTASNAIFYINNANKSGQITIYQDEAMTTPVTIRQMYDVARSGKNIKFVLRNASEGTYSERRCLSVINSVYPAILSSSSLDEVTLTMWISVRNNISVISNFSTNPDDAVNAFSSDLS